MVCACVKIQGKEQFIGKCCQDSQTSPKSGHLGKKGHTQNLSRTACPVAMEISELAVTKE